MTSSRPATSAKGVAGDSERLAKGTKNTQKEGPELDGFLVVFVLFVATQVAEALRSLPTSRTDRSIVPALGQGPGNKIGNPSWLK
jgi:hypothetical protein